MDSDLLHLSPGMVQALSNVEKSNLKSWAECCPDPEAFFSAKKIERVAAANPEHPAIYAQPDGKLVAGRKYDEEFDLAALAKLRNGGSY